jgi:hypothetical protein
MSRLMISKRSVALVALMSATVAVTGCSTVSKLNPFHGKDKNKSTATQGQRISVIAFDQKVEPNESLKGADFFLPEPVAQAEWRLPGGNAEQSIEHVDAGKAFEIAWKKGFGKKGGKTFHVTAPPVSAGGRIYVMDGEADVVALDAKSGLADLAQGPASRRWFEQEGRFPGPAAQEERPHGLWRRRRRRRRQQALCRLGLPLRGSDGHRVGQSELDAGRSPPRSTPPRPSPTAACSWSRPTTNC